MLVFKLSQAHLLVRTKYDVGIQSTNLPLKPVMLLYLTVLQTTNLGIKPYLFFSNRLINKIKTLQNYLRNSTVITPDHSGLVGFVLQKL